MAEAAGVRREMWSKYESGAEPGADALAAAGRAGVDVSYVLLDADGRRVFADVELKPHAGSAPDKPFHLSAYVARESAAPWKVNALVPDATRSRGNAQTPAEPVAALLRDRGAGAVHPLLLSLPQGEKGGPGRDYELIPKHVRPASAGRGGNKSGATTIDQVDLVGEMAFSFDWLRHNLGHTSGQITSIQVRGDSMATTLLDGDTIMIDEGIDGIDVDGIYVLDVNGRRLVKRIQQLFDGTLVLISDNQSYQRETIPRDLARNVKVIGRMVWPKVR